MALAKLTEFFSQLQSQTKRPAAHRRRWGSCALSDGSCLLASWQLRARHPPASADGGGGGGWLGACGSATERARCGC